MRHEPLDDETAATLGQATPDEAGRELLSELAESAQTRGNIGLQVRIAQRAVELAIQNWSATEDDYWTRSAFKDLQRLATSVGRGGLVSAPLQSLVEIVRARIPRKHDAAAYLARELAELVAWENCEKADELYLLARDEELLQPAAEAEKFWRLGNFDFASANVDDHVDELAKAGRSAEGPPFVAGYLLRTLRSPETDADDIGSFYLIFLEALENAGAAEHASHLEEKLDPDGLAASPRDEWCNLLRHLQEPMLPVGDCAPTTAASQAAPTIESQSVSFDLRPLLESERIDLEVIVNEQPFELAYRLLDTKRTAAADRLAVAIEHRFGREHPLLVPFHADAARRLQASGRTADAVAALEPVAASLRSADWNRLGLSVETPLSPASSSCLSSKAVVRARCTALEAAEKLAPIAEARSEIKRILATKARNPSELADAFYGIAAAAGKAKDYTRRFQGSISYVKMQYSLMQNNEQNWKDVKDYAESSLQGFVSPNWECKNEILLKGWEFIPPDCAEQQWNLAKSWPELFKEAPSLDEHLLQGFVNAQEEYVAVAPERAEEVAVEGLRVFERFRIPGPSDVAGEFIQRAALAEIGEEAVLAVQRGRDTERRWVETAERLFAVRRNGDREEIAELERETGILGRDLEEARQSRADLEGKAADAVRQRTLDVQSVQALLALDEAIVLYRTSLYRVVAWVIRENRVVQRQLPLKATDLAELTARLLNFDPEYMQAGRWPEEVDVGAAHELHQALVAPLADTLDGAAVLNIIPDGPLVGVPFAMLVSEPPLEKKWAPNRTWRPAWLLDRYAFATAPTVRGLLALRSDVRPSRADRAFAGFGAPRLSGTVSPWGPDAIPLLASGSGLEQLRQLSPLPDAEQELRAASAHFPEDKRLLLMGAEFTEARLRSLGLDRYRTLLFATHAIPSGVDRMPMLVLTPPEIARPEDDGVLSPGEVAGLRLDAELVILSACRTGLVARGEKGGYGDLVSAFFAAGSRAVMATYWPVDSATAPRLTVPVTEAVAGGGYATAVRALRQAALAVSLDQARPDLAHPVHWAAFYIVGAPGLTR